jgi:site-specific DNA-methyltransferase (adenine-specific)
MQLLNGTHHTKIGALKMSLIKKIILGDNLLELPKLPNACVSMIYIDPPFNTGETIKRDRINVVASETGDRVGFGGKTYQSTKIEGSPTYTDIFEDFESFLMPRIEASLHCLTANGSLFVHLDYREVHYIKVALDKLLGRDHFINEIIWSYDYGARSKKKWSAKHNNILWYVMNPKDYIFDYDAMERIPYMAPALVGEEKAARGKTPTDVFWHTIVPTNGKEKTGYPTQKPMGLLERLIKVHTNTGDTVLDFFCGSGTTGHAALKNNRGCILIDQNSEAIKITTNRLSDI